MDDFRNEVLDYDGSFQRTLTGTYLWMMIALATTGMTKYKRWHKPRNSFLGIASYF